MISPEVPTTPQPTTAIAALQARIRATEISLKEARDHRAEIEARIDAAGGPGERAGLRAQLRPIDAQIGQLESQLLTQRAQLRQLEATPVTPVPGPVVPQPTLPPPPVPVILAPPPTTGTTVPPATPIEPAFVLGGLAIVFVLAPLAFALAVRLIRRGGSRRQQTDDVSDGRLGRMEDSLAALTLDVDRIAENQRFLTQALVGDGKQPLAREELHTRR